MSSFALDMKAWAAKAGANIDTVVRTTVASVGEGVVSRSPVGNRELWAVNIDRATRGLPPVPKNYTGGRFRGSWQYGFSAAPSADVQTIDPTGAISMERIVSGVGSSPAAGMHYIANNLSYGQALEDGHSTQAPSGMVGLTVLEFQQIVDAAVANLQK